MEKILQDMVPTRTDITDTNPHYRTNFVTQFVQEEVNGDQWFGGAVILAVQCPFPERLNQSRQGMGEAGDIKPK